MPEGTGKSAGAGRRGEAPAKPAELPDACTKTTLRRPAPVLIAVLAIAAGAGGALALTSGSSSPAPPAGRALAPAQAAALVGRAQAVVDVRPTALGYRLAVAGPRAGVRGQTDRARRTITLYLAAGDPAHRVAHDLAHEIGHAYDDRRLTAAGRAAWLRARGAAGRPWSPGEGASDYASGAGDFAEVYARCHAASPDFRSRLAPAPRDPCASLPRGAR